MLKHLLISVLFLIHWDSTLGYPRKYNRPNKYVSTEFDILVLSQLWPQTSCWKINSLWNSSPECSPCDVPNTYNNWTLHGLWPSNKRGGSPQHCDHSAKFKENSLNKDLQIQMESKWASSKMGKSNADFWKHEWEKHGTCALELKDTNSMNNYFSQSLSLLDKYNVGRILSENNITPGNKYQVREIYDTIRRNLNVNPFVKCTIKPGGMKEQYIDEVHICFDKTFELVDCKDDDNISNCIRKKAVIYPENLPPCY